MNIAKNNNDIKLFGHFLVNQSYLQKGSRSSNDSRSLLAFNINLKKF